jgi:1-acyl-sn-glycerol-3-phosphate acyltransferase
MMSWIYWLGWALFGSLFRSVFGLKVTGREHLITEGPVLIISNHQSFIDPPLLGSIYQHAIWYLARKTLFTGFAGWLYPRWNAIPVDQDKPDMASLKSVIKLLKEGETVVIFPEGERTGSGDLGEAAPGAGLVAVKAGVPIQPLRIRGAYEALPRGSSRISLSRISVTIGPPIRLSPEELKQASGKGGYDQLAKRLMAAVAAL